MAEREALLIPLREVKRLLGLRSQSALYALLKRTDAAGRPVLPAVKLGRLTMVPAAALHAFLAALPPAEPGGEAAERMNRARREGRA